MTVAHIFDIGAAGVLAFFMVRGALRGLTGEVVSLLGLVASVVCGWTFAQPLAQFVLQYFPEGDKAITELLCSVVIFVGVSLAFSALARVLQMIVKAASLSFVDHALGAVSGAARAFFVVLFIYGGFSIFSPILPGAWMKDSIAMRGAAVVWPPVLKILIDNGWIDLSQVSGPLSPSEAGLPVVLFNLAGPVTPTNSETGESQGEPRRSEDPKGR
ncbi:MAG: CvpA family protein [Synergistaceae bacterium]|nr:CvpA family protein [Synergistaceae bacterium]